MELSKAKFDELLEKHDFGFECSPDRFFDFVSDVLEAEGDATKEKYPDAANTIDRLYKAAYQVWEIGSDVAGGFFDGEL